MKEEILFEFSCILLDQFLCKFYGFLDKIHPQKGFPTKKSNIEKAVLKFYRFFHCQANSRFHDLVTHHGTTFAMGFPIIAIATTKITLFSYT